MRRDWANDGRLWFTKGMPLDQKEGQLVVFVRRTCEFECVIPRREKPFDTLTASQEWCEENDPANQPKPREPAEYDWRKHWQPKTRDGLEVVDVRPRTSNIGLKSLSVCESGAYREVWHDIDGRNEGGVPGRDLLPVDPVASPVEADPLLVEAKKIKLDIAEAYRVGLVGIQWKLRIVSVVSSVIARFAVGTMPKEQSIVELSGDTGRLLADAKRLLAKYNTAELVVFFNAVIHWIGDGTTPGPDRQINEVAKQESAPKESASPAVQPQFVKGQTVVCVDDRKAGDFLLNNQSYVIDGVFGNVVYFDKTPWHARRFRALTAEEQRAEEKTKPTYEADDMCPECSIDRLVWTAGGVLCPSCGSIQKAATSKAAEQLQPFKIGDVVKWKDGGITRRTVTEIGSDDRCGMIRVDNMPTWNAAEDCEVADSLKTEETKAKPKFCVGKKVRVIPGMGCGNMLVGESEHVCSAVHDGRIEIDGISTQWDDRCFEVVEETVIVPWESLAEVPLDAWFRYRSDVESWRKDTYDWRRITKVFGSALSVGIMGGAYCVETLFKELEYTLDPRQDPPVVHRCGNVMQKGARS